MTTEQTKIPLPCSYCTPTTFKGWREGKCPYCGKTKPMNKQTPLSEAPTCCRKHWQQHTAKQPTALGNQNAGFILLNPFGMPLITCVICGFKRCPKATNCSLECTASNDPGQEGSIYG